MKLVIIGPVGSGKGTQAQAISWRLHYSRHSTGDLIRDHVEAGSPLGKQMKDLLDRGEPVPDNIIMRLVVPLLFPGGGFILDGCPLNMTQARALDAAFEERHGGPSRVLMLDGPTDDELVERVLGGRLVSKTTNYTYHEKYAPPPGPEQQTDPGPFVRLPDDKEDVLRRRIAAYRKEADELKEHYSKRGVLALIDARQPIEKVTEDIFDAINNPPQQTTE
ncbi:AAA family ATPase [Rubrobacter marinus]|uniref:Adenylate kinase n=1 Tax=Rubrobacter marinus TaxID=2653852 RepID=A0A6G8PTN7_9ACTN|nr:nucleoside monophosphate kinase [Rubrobacter marinus]QIN77326.1 AAA family ATPase [Rubrobacter marinus]